MPLRQLSLCVILAAACSGPPALAQQPPQPDAKSELANLLKVIIADLASEDVVLRIDAHRRLTDSTSIRLRDIEQAASGATFTPEQRKRLAAAAFIRFCLEPRAGMGIQSTMDVGERGLVLQAVVPGFPAAEVLRAGDRVLSVNGHAINDISMMRPVVISRDPGDEVPVVIVRGGVTLNLKVRLGRASELNARDRFSITNDMLAEAWQFRRSPYADAADDGRPPIESGLSDAAWQYAGTAEVGIDYNDGGDPNIDPRLVDARRLQDPDRREVNIAAVGEPRGAGPQVRWAMQGGVPPTVRVAPGMQIQIAPNRNQLAGDDLARLREQQVAALRSEQAILKMRIEELRGELATAGQARRTQINDQIARMTRRIAELEVQMRPAILVNP